MGTSSSTNRRSKEKTNLDVMSVSSGFRSEKIAFTWKIENFDVVRQSKEQICAQKFEFNVGDKIGLPCKVGCCLHYAEPNQDENLSRGTGEEPLKKWIGLYYNLVQAPESASHVNTQMQIEICNKHGHIFLNLDGGVADLVAKQGWGFPEVLYQDASTDKFPLIEGTLVIRIKLTIFAQNPAITQATTSNMLRVHKMNSTRGISKSVHNLIQDYNKLLRQENETEGNEEDKGFADVKIKSNDNKHFRAHRAILAVRSPVFEAMFRNNMTEAQTGVVNIPDLSSSTLNVLLQFIYTGTLPPHNWSKPDVIVELTNAAAKYELKDLLEFLDGKLGSVCDDQTAGKLLLLASRLQLHKAEKQILEYIKRHGIAKSKDFISIVKHIAEDEN